MTANTINKEDNALHGATAATADDEWDLQMKADAASGKLDFVDRHVENSHRNATQAPMDHILEEN
jgi:hypothetical protein